MHSLSALRLLVAIYCLSVASQSYKKLYPFKNQTSVHSSVIHIRQKLGTVHTHQLVNG